MTRETRGNFLLSSIGFIANLYAISLLLSIPYYNWQYARHHSFSDWLIWGEIAPTAKALVWPYFAMRPSIPTGVETDVPTLSEKQINEMNIRSADRAMAAAAQGTYLLNSRKSGPLTSEREEALIAFSVEALHSADATNEEALNKIYPDFGTRFKRDFCGGNRLFISGLRNQSRNDLVKAHEFDLAWSDWYNANRQKINEVFVTALQ